MIWDTWPFQKYLSHSELIDDDDDDDDDDEIIQKLKKNEDWVRLKPTMLTSSATSLRHKNNLMALVDCSLQATCWTG